MAPISPLHSSICFCLHINSLWNSVGNGQWLIASMTQRFFFFFLLTRNDGRKCPNKRDSWLTPVEGPNVLMSEKWPHFGTGFASFGHVFSFFADKFSWRHNPGSLYTRRVGALRISGACTHVFDPVDGIVVGDLHSRCRRLALLAGGNHFLQLVEPQVFRRCRTAHDKTQKKSQN